MYRGHMYNLLWSHATAYHGHMLQLSVITCYSFLWSHAAELDIFLVCALTDLKSLMRTFLVKVPKSTLSPKVVMCESTWFCQDSISSEFNPQYLAKDLPGIFLSCFSAMATKGRVQQLLHRS